MWKPIFYFRSPSFWLQPWLLHALFWANLLGTLYGYEWYRGQLVDTWTTQGGWLVLFVPDSPTASLFFTATLWFLIRDRRRTDRKGTRLESGAAAAAGAGAALTWRGAIEALAVITQVKYGVWAVAIIFWGASRGDALVWQEWMLVVSHSCMAAEALLYMRFYRFTALAAAVGAAWTLTNDAIDYTAGVFPYLPSPLYDELQAVQWFTVGLSAVGIACAFAGAAWIRKNRV